MLDYRIYTFLSLCETQSYTRTAALLQMTQPGVTQHVQFLERAYGVRLFRREGRSIALTQEGEQLAQHLRRALSADRQQQLQLSAPKSLPFRIGATKTIGDFVITDAVCRLARAPQYRLSLEVENTDVLLHRLDRLEIDLALLEGVFDKSRYAHRLLRVEPFLGICARTHPFAGQCVPLEELFSQQLLLREPGSGTRSIFEDALRRHSFSTRSFRQESCISSFALIKALLRAGLGISFAYQSVVRDEPALATFTLENESLYGEFNYVFLPGYEESPWFLDAFVNAMEGEG